MEGKSNIRGREQEKEPPVGGKSNIRGREQGERASCGKKIQYERKKTEGKDLLWIKKTTWEGRIIKKEPPRRNKSIRGGDKSGKLNPIKWTQQKPIWGCFLEARPILWTQQKLVLDAF